MKSRLIRISLSVAIGVGLLAGLIWILIRTLGEKQALYQGKSRFYWSEQIKSPSMSASNQARLVLNQEIIPRLTKTLFADTNDSSLRIALVENLNSLPGVHIVLPTADSRRAEAALALGEFGPAGEAAVPALLRAVQGHDSAVRGHAAVSLSQIRANPGVIIPMLIAYLGDDGIRESAAEALGNYGSLAKAAIPKLLLLFEIRDKDLHHAVAEALKNIDPEAAAQAGILTHNRPEATQKAGRP